MIQAKAGRVQVFQCERCGEVTAPAGELGAASFEAALSACTQRGSLHLLAIAALGGFANMRPQVIGDAV